MKKPVNILIVEDSPSQAEMLRNIVSGAGYKVTVAPNGAEALSAIGINKPDIIISDIIMPGMDGFDFCSAVREDSTFSDIPLIILTSLSDTSDVVRALQCGANRFLTKPFDKDLLLSNIESALKNHNLRSDGKADNAMEFYFDGNMCPMPSNHSIVLELLLSVYETAVRKNKKLREAEIELRELNRQLKDSNDILINEIEQRRKAEVLASDSALRVKQLENELRSFDRLSNHAGTSVTAEAYGQLPLKEGSSEIFAGLVKDYGAMMDAYLDTQTFKVGYDISEKLRALVDRIGILKGGPRDLVDIHTAALKEKVKGFPPGKAQAYAEECRMMIVELMGYLVTFYRNFFIISGRLSDFKKNIK